MRKKKRGQRERFCCYFDSEEDKLELAKTSCHIRYELGFGSRRFMCARAVCQRSLSVNFREWRSERKM